MRSTSPTTGRWRRRWRARGRTSIINCAAYNDVDGAEDHPVEALNVNAFAVRALARAAAEHGATLVHYSTDFVFDGTATAALHGNRSAESEEHVRRVEAPRRVVCRRRASRLRAARREPVRPRGGRRAVEGQRRVDREDARWPAGKRACSRIARCRRPTSSTPRAATLQLVEQNAPAGLYHCVNSGPLHVARVRAGTGAAAGRRAAARARADGRHDASRPASALLRACRPPSSRRPVSSCRPGRMLSAASRRNAERSQR